MRPACSSPRAAARLALLLCALAHASACTILAAGPGATDDGSVLVSHSSDGEGASDPRVKRVPAAKHAKGSVRKVYQNDILLPAQQTLLGTVPQVERTFGYLHEAYGAINDQQLVMGESTCSSTTADGIARPRGQNGGKALFGIQALTELAMERCGTAICAVKVMGELATSHGFYQDAATPTGEALVVGDPKELWIFHILPDPTGASAVWAAQRVPTDHVVVVANAFVIRELDLSDENNNLASANIQDVAASRGWQRGTPLDFSTHFSAGEYIAKYYSGRRVWRAYTLLAEASAAASLSPVYGQSGDHEDGDMHALIAQRPYPTSLPATKLTPARMMRTLRDYYEGTPYDLSSGLAAGPWGSPNRYMLGDGSSYPAERPISIFRTACSYVAQARSWLPNATATLWFGPHSAHGTVYVPLAVGMPALPASHARIDLSRPDRASAFWAHVAVQALAHGRWRWIAPEVTAMQAEIESRLRELQAKADEVVVKSHSSARGLEEMGEMYVWNAEAVTRTAWNLFDSLLYRYADGFVRKMGGDRDPAASGYPLSWLKAIDAPLERAGAHQDGKVTPALKPPAEPLIFADRAVTSGTGGPTDFHPPAAVLELYGLSTRPAFGATGNARGSGAASLGVVVGSLLVGALLGAGFTHARALRAARGGSTIWEAVRADVGADRPHAVPETEWPVAVADEACSSTRYTAF